MSAFTLVSHARPLPDPKRGKGLVNAYTAFRSAGMPCSLLGMVNQKAATSKL